MAVPVQLPTTAQNETFGGVTYHIQGELVPALQLELTSTSVYFEHHILLWKDPAVEIELHPMKGAFKRMLAGMPFLLTGAKGPGRIALLSRDGVGQVFALQSMYFHMVSGVFDDPVSRPALAPTEPPYFIHPGSAFRGLSPMQLLALGDSGRGGGTQTLARVFALENRGKLGLRRFHLFFEVSGPPKLSRTQFKYVHPQANILPRHPMQPITHPAQPLSG